MRWIKSRRGGHRKCRPPSLPHRDLEASPSRDVVLTAHPEHISVPPPMFPTSSHFWQPFHLSSRNNSNHLPGLPKMVFGFLFLLLLVAFGSCIEEKGEISAFHHLPPSAAVWGEGNWGSGKSKHQVPGSYGRKDSELGARRDSWGTGSLRCRMAKPAVLEEAPYIHPTAELKKIHWRISKRL